ncbi:aldehyde ferredoxin oxidoreductase family protein [Candidatus Bathyarchaeota archaeon]|nr:aldehyde ferredoxin oxidoreductase family protein [Candidatus Bathyarchaeota archaeon]
MYGYAGKVIRVDLTKSNIAIEALKKELASQYIGGKGLGAKFLLIELEPGTDAFDPSNLLIFATGPVNGMVLPGAAKFCTIFKSPLTGIWGESQCGGYFAHQLKCAGYDMIIIRGRSKKPVYLTIEDEKIEIRDASHLWGEDAFETEGVIKKNHGEKFQVLSIGPAGENLVRYACITHDKGRQFGRCGAGAVMGSKKLKAIAVKGSGNIEMAKPEELDRFRRELNEKVKERLKSLMEYGTPAIMALTNTTGTLPTRYWTEGEFEGFEKICAETLKKRFVERSKACFACTVACGKISVVRKVPDILPLGSFATYVDSTVEGPEYETLFALGSLCGNDNLESIIKANEICDRLGIDTISAGNAVAFAMYCYEKGIITKEETEGIDLKFGNSEAIIATLRKIAYRNGFGNILAEGVKRAAEIIGKGSEKIAVHVKGLEPPGYDPRGLKGVALAYAVSCRGACHLRHMAYRPNLTGQKPFEKEAINRLSYQGQAEMVKELEDFHTIVDCMVLCKFVCLPTIGPILWDELTKLYTIITGKEIKKEDLIKIAQNINNIIRKFNSREGLNRKHDNLPQRFFNEGLKTGASAGEKIQKQEFKKMLNKYYKLRGLNTQDKQTIESI